MISLSCTVLRQRNLQKAAITEAFETRDSKNIQTLKAVKIMSRVFWSPLSDPVVLKYTMAPIFYSLKDILSPFVAYGVNALSSQSLMN